LHQEILELDELVQPVAKHILKAGGKRLRPLLCLLTAKALGYHEVETYPLACSLELIHSATLLHDDVIDNSVLRRGKTSAHLLYGITETILSGDALLAMANKIVTRYDCIELLKCISEAIYQTAVGEILEISKMRQPGLSTEEYLNIIIGKTGYLIQTCCESGAILSRAENSQIIAAREFGLNLGIAFQLVDDALDYSSQADISGKPLGGDLREGKLTLPLIFFLGTLNQESKANLLQKIKDRTLTEDEHYHILEQISNLGLIEQTRAEAGFYLQQAEKKLQEFPASSSREMLQEIIEYITNRNY
jgi:octaprenyl-diphosphate synthase